MPPLWTQSAPSDGVTSGYCALFGARMGIGTRDAVLRGVVEGGYAEGATAVRYSHPGEEALQEAVEAAFKE